MATSLTRFEIVLPSVDTGSSDDTAMTNFRRNMETLTTRLFFTTAYRYDASDALTQRSILYGYITIAQQSTALGYLNTLNAALSAGNTPVDCEIWNVTSEP